MKVILIRIGKFWVIRRTIEVKPGYGRNYLIPQELLSWRLGRFKRIRHRLQHLEKLREGKIDLHLNKRRNLNT
ncbi:MAG: hypothetical protein Ct9H300mP28_09390 [Pseudomonadota bacterium]|nr:MAG: hypothetical protein Ct9H300mP28_09390 [Pseudomonadota bacterium]